jgi:pimeloyl-ACP methyl ester carboxylesterase
MSVTPPPLRRVEVPTPVGTIVARVSETAPGPATVLLHGAAGSWTTWLPLLSAADAAGAPLPNVVALDLPGWGESAGPVPDAAMLACAIATAVRALGHERWRLIGHSLGGAVALDVAARFPEETEGVLLISASGAAVREAVRHPLRGGLRLPGFAGMVGAMRLLRALGPAGPVLLRALRRSGMLRLLAAPLFRHPSRVDTRVVAALADEIRPVSFLAAVAAARDEDETLWTRIRCRVRAVRGAHDVFARAVDAHVFAVRIHDFAETVLPASGHFAHVEEPDAVLAAFRALLPAGAGGVRGAA